MRSHADQRNVWLNDADNSLHDRSIIVDFHVEIPQSLASTCASLLQGLVVSGATVAVSTSALSFAADTSTMTPPQVAATVINCVGTWVADSSCSAPCGPDGNVSLSL